MKKVVGKVVSVHAGSNEDLSKEEHATIQVELDGISGDRHQSYERTTWDDRQNESVRAPVWISTL